MHHPDQSTDKSLPFPATDLPPGDISDLAHLLRSPPPVPSSPAPAYTALPYRDVAFHLAPLFHGRPGDIELETTDGKRFLVHRKILEQETVFFHIYYGFIPVWRLATPHIGPPHPNLPVAPPASTTCNTAATAAGAINNLLCLPKLLASTLRATTTSANGPGIILDGDNCPLLSSDSEDTRMDGTPPPPPPKDVRAPTPTSNPYTWVVPESSSILASFLYLIYPRGTFQTTLAEALPTLEITGRVIRASMGYQSSKALNSARDRLHSFIDAQPVETYAMACFFKFNDLARLSSSKAISTLPSEWTSEIRGLMGRSGMKQLSDLREIRMAGLRGVLNTPVVSDHHSNDCLRRDMMESVWRFKVNEVKKELRPESDLLELLEIDLRGGHCGDCLVLLGQTIQTCLHAAKELPVTV